MIKSITTRRMALVSASLLVMSGAVLGQQQQEQEQQASPPPILAINSAGIDAMLSSPKDRALRGLLHHIAPRLSELPEELERLDIDGASQIPPGTFEAAWNLFSQPQALELRLNLGRLRNQEMPVDFRWASVAKDNASASETVGFARELLRETPLRLRPSSEAGSFIAETPAMPLYFGTRRNGDDAIMYFSTEESKLPELGASFVSLPEGVEQVMGLRFDLSQLAPVIGMPIGMAPPIVGELLMEAGLVGWDATRFDFAVGYDERAMHSVARMTGAARAARLLATDPGRTLTANDFAMIPGDATMASMSFYDASKTWDLGVRVMKSLGVWDQIRTELRENLDLETDQVEGIVRSLGDTWVIYQSDTTGGGEFSSLIVSVSIRDRDVLEAALSSAAGRLNTLAREEAEGYARVRTWEREGARYYSLVAPGLPIPVEPTLALHGDRLVVAMSVPSLMAALNQLGHGRDSLGDRADLKALAGGSFDGLAGFSFNDTERYARRGYGSMNHVMAGLANGVRSPLSDREPYGTGPMMPSFGELMDGIIPTVTTTRWDGEDLIVTGIADRSITVHLAAGFGKMNLGAMYSQFVPMMFAGGSSVFSEARFEAERNAERAASVHKTRIVTMAAIAYATDKGGYPGSVAELVDEGYLDTEALQSSFGSMMDGTPDIVMRPDVSGQEVNYSTRMVIALDRSALAYSGFGAVGFADAHVEWLSHHEIEELLSERQNRGAREAFGF